MLAYSAGLRVSGVVKLRGQDIDTKHNMLHIKEAKGRKDRYTVFCYPSFGGWYRFTVYSGVTWA
jgi:site-specific recombinase XerD